MIATGRSMEAMQPTLDKYQLQCGLILMNGAEVRDEQHKIINTIDLDNSTIPAIAKRLEEMGYIPEYMTNSGSQICTTEDKMICRSLISWINDGSHSIPDDLYIDSYTDSVDRYKVIFREIFIKMDHKAHYDMMMS